MKPAAPRQSFSLRTHLMLGAGGMAVVFLLGLYPALQQIFTGALEQAIEQRLAADASALVSAARVVDGRLQMPHKLPDEEFPVLPARQLGYIYDSTGKLLWHSRSAAGVTLDYQPRYDGQGHVFTRTRSAQGDDYFLYDVEIDLLRGNSAAYSIVTLQPVRDYRQLYRNLKHQLYGWLAGSLFVLLGFLWLGLGWGTRSLQQISRELDEVETGQRDSLGDQHPAEVLRLTRTLNRLLDSERRQGSRYKHSLDDLAHSLKTPLAVLQGVGEMLARQPENSELARTLQTQVGRMSQQVDYQLQRASLRKSGLLRHSEPLAAVIQPVLDALGKVYADKQVQVELCYPDDFRVPLEQAALYEVLGNLLENAYRLCLGRIRISANISKDCCELHIEDDGPGVPAGQRERILQRGERLDTQNPGQGIGTAVVKDILDSYNGQLLIEDSALGGASFRLRLPLY